MSPSDEQLEVLRLIWNEMKTLNSRVDGVKGELTAVRTELKAEISAMRVELRAEDEALRRRLTESEIRVSTAVTELSGETRGLASLIREWREEHRTDRLELRARVDRIEQHLGLGKT